MKTLLLTNHYEGLPLEILQKAVGDRFSLQMLDEVCQDDLERRISEADYLLFSGRLCLDEKLLSHAERLRMVQRTGVGLDTIDFDALRRHGIPLYVNRSVNAVSVAEHTMMLILSVLRRAFFVNCQIRKGIWQKQQTGLSTHELAGKTVGIVGMGSIGRRVAELLSPFDVKILYTKRNRLDAVEEDRLHARYSSLEELLRCADIVTLHCSGEKENRHMISRNELSQMKEGAILINTSRGGLVDTEALISVLKSGKLAGVGLDVYEDEPIGRDHPLFCFDNAILTPHVGGVTYEAFSCMMNQALDNIAAFDDGQVDEIEEHRVC